MTNKIKMAYQPLCETVAEERINTLFSNATKEKKELYIKTLTARLMRMYDDFFDAGHLNAVTMDVVDEVNSMIRQEQANTPVAIINIAELSPVQAMKILNSLMG